MKDGTQTITVRLANGSSHVVPKGISLIELANSIPHGSKWPVMAAKVDNDLKELGYVLDDDCEVEFVDLGTEDGMRIYRRTTILIFVRAAREILPGCRVRIMHSLSNGLYGEVQWERPINEAHMEAVDARMREIIGRDEPIIKRAIPVSQAIEMFRSDGQMDKVRLLKYRDMPEVNVYSCGDFTDYLYGFMAPSAGCIKSFSVRLYLPGFILEFPDRSDPTVLPTYKERGKLASVYFEAGKFGRILQVSDVAALNDVVKTGRIDELIRLSEAFHEKKIARIADRIAADRDRISVVLIAGPSSSGKTTFAQRLWVQMRVNGLRPVPLSLDDYFVDRSRTPIGSDGNPDYESINAIDLELFNQHLTQLIQGEEVEVPIFSFVEGRRLAKGKLLHLEKDEMLIIEGIHGLNDVLTRSIPKSRKYKIYASALTQLNLDDHNRIPTTDVRILRRIIRDNRSRGHSAQATIRMWPKVRAGEERNIFPFQEDADVMFNSALVYELAVLKPYALPLLESIGRDQPEYVEAKRLRRFLTYFIPIEGADVPTNSIIREFIGGGCFS